MTEHNVGARQEVGQAETQAWLQGFTGAVAQLAENQDRPISSAWATSLVQDRLHNPHFQDLLTRFHDVNPGATPSEAQRRFLSAEQAGLLAAQNDGQLPLPKYPSEQYAEPKIWGSVYRWYRETHGYGNRYYDDVVRRPLTTSVSQRTVAVRFLGRVLPHIFGEEPKWASCGSGDMAGDKRKLLQDHATGFEFDPVAVRHPNALGDMALSAYMADIFNGIVQEPDDTKEVVCLDQTDPTIPANIAWGHACSTPEEILSGSWDDLHDRLMRAAVPEDKLHFRLADLSKRADMRAVVEQEGVFDGASALFSWYQGSAETRRRKLLNMREVLVREDGGIVIADFARVVGRGTFLAPQDIWKKPTVFLGHRGELHPVLLASSGRFEEVQVLHPLVRLARGGPHEQEIRELAS